MTILYVKVFMLLIYCNFYKIIIDKREIDFIFKTFEF